MTKKNYEATEKLTTVADEENKKRILRKFWHDFSNDLFRFTSDQFGGLERYFKGYSNGLEQANIISIDEHIEITDRITNKINQERVLREQRNQRLFKQV